MKFEIKNRVTGKLIFECEADSWRVAVELAIKSEANLSRANLSRANLSWANLYGANLSRANLSWANLSEANLSGANLSGANLSRADLSRANLSRANLYGANLSRADLSRANLSRANLSRADLSRADLSVIRDDLWAVFSSAPREVKGLRQALIDGKVDGSTYSGECACLVGTIANVRGSNYEMLGTLKPQSSRPAERFFLAIRKGDTPEKSPFSKKALEWTDEWLENMKSAFGITEVKSDKEKRNVAD